MRTRSTVRRLLVALAAVLLVRSASADPLPPPWIARGDRVQASYAAYGERLDRFYASLTEQLKQDAPDLLALLKEETPPPPVHGYQMLPKLAADIGPPAQRPRADVRSYSWPWTQTMIDRETKNLDALEAEFARARSAPASEKRALYAKLAADYKPLPPARNLIDVHIQYNRLWQKSIAFNRALYDGQTQLELDVMERQAMHDVFAAPDEASFRKTLVELTNLPGARLCGPTVARAQCEDALRGRETVLARDIHLATDAIVPPAFVRIEHPTPHRWIVRVPFITDIEDAGFLRAFRAAVEENWRIKDGEDEYRAEISTEFISTARLYQGSGLTPPKPGEAFDLSRHLALFPPGAAILTTGAPTTNVNGGPLGIVIGTNEIRPHDLAHEFGHILGFKDVYFRGYVDRGADGFDVQEIIADPDDIMGAPGWGSVRKEHFTRLIEASAK